MAIAYRKEIDGLRAVAVVPVILFHAGVTLFSGGFVGVDIFFVISGYLITSILMAENAAGTYSIVRFYERRARRILPALFLVMFATFSVAWFILLPKEMKDFSLSLAAVAGFASNFLFWSSSGYFDSASELKPMLHTWSLAVEEQYYIIFPVFLAFMWSRVRNALGVSMLTIAIVSMGLSQWLLQDKQSEAFYLIHSRCWELLIGSLAALVCFGKDISAQNFLIRQFASLLGLALVLCSMFFFSNRTPFPGLYAAVPVFGSALILVFADSNTLVGKMLAWRPFVFVGLISYSLYLWHQPVFAFARLSSVDVPSLGFMLFLSVMSVALAYISWKYIEAPFRMARNFSSRSVFLFAMLGIFIFSGLGYLGSVTNGFAGRLTQAQAELLSFESKDLTRINRLRTCFLEGSQDPVAFRDECFPVKKGGVLIWGDSHAAALFYGLNQVLGPVGQLTAGSCPPLKDVIIEWRPKCKSVNDFAVEKIIKLQPDLLIMDANWDIYHWQKPEIELVKTVNFIRARSPGTRFLIVGIVPKWKQALPKLMYRTGTYLDGEHSMGGALVEIVSAWDKKVQSAAVQAGAMYFSPFNIWCHQTMCKASIEVDGKFYPTAWDYGHLTTGASVALAREIAKTVPVNIRGVY